MILHNREPKRLLNDQPDFNKLNSYSVQELMDVMKTMDFEKIGITPAELFEDYVNEIRSVHNTELGQKQKNPPKNQVFHRKISSFYSEEIAQNIENFLVLRNLCL